MSYVLLLENGAATCSMNMYASSILTWHVDPTCFSHSMWYFWILGSLNLQDSKYLVYFSFVTKGKYSIEIFK